MKTELLSHSLGTQTPLYGGATDILVASEKCLAEGDSCNSLKLSFPNHASTHIDMPSHFIAGGKTLTDVPASYWSFNNTAIWRRPASGAELLEFDSTCPGDADTELLLIRTGWEARRGTTEYWAEGPGLSPQLAAALRSKSPRLRAIGVDFISITSYKHREAGRDAHRQFLSRDFMLIEDMRLSGLDAIKGEIDMVVVAPLLIEKGDGAPAMVLAFHGKG